MRDVIEVSPVGSASSWRARLRRRFLARRIVASIDRERLEAVRASYPRDSREWRSKYWQLEAQISKNVARAQRLGLVGAERRRVLDLGCGFGYFCYVASRLGHEALGLDLETADDASVYGRVAGVLGVERRLHTVQPDVPLPALGPFDLVTAFNAQFNRPETSQPWGPEEWAFFLDEVTARWLGAGGVLHLLLVPGPGGECWAPGTKELLLARGARVAGNEAQLRVPARTAPGAASRGPGTP